MFPDDRPLDFNWRIPIGRRREGHGHLNWSPAVKAAVIARERRRHLDAPVRLDAVELRFVASPLAPESPMQPETGLYRAVPACEVVAVLLQKIFECRFHFSLILCKFHIMFLVRYPSGLLTDLLVSTAHPLSSRFNVGCVPRCCVWIEENSAIIIMWFCCGLVTCEALAQPNRMRKRYVHALDLSPGFSDFGKLA